MDPVLTQIEGVLDRYVRPSLAAHRGNVEVAGYAGGTVRCRLTGQCSGCPAASITTHELIEVALTARLPQVTRVVLVQKVSENLLDQARAILRGERRYG